MVPSGKDRSPGGNGAPARGRRGLRHGRRGAPGGRDGAVAVLVRHGRTPTTGSVLPGRAKGLHLAEEGRAQAEAVARALSGLPGLSAVYASPLERTRETAAPIARELGVRVVVDRGLLECDFGTWTGSELGRLRRLPEWRRVQQWPSSFRFPEGESFLELYARISSTLQRLAERHRGGAFVAVSHADPIKAALAWALGMPLDHFQRLDVAPCSVSAVVLGKDGPRVLGMNVRFAPEGSGVLW
jgi:probable phosphomutase (TIGR03848 family)